MHFILFSPAQCSMISPTSVLLASLFLRWCCTRPCRDPASAGNAQCTVTREVRMRLLCHRVHRFHTVITEVVAFGGVCADTKAVGVLQILVRESTVAVLITQGGAQAAAAIVALAMHEGCLGALEAIVLVSKTLALVVAAFGARCRDGDNIKACHSPAG